MLAHENILSFGSSSNRVERRAENAIPLKSIQVTKTRTDLRLNPTRHVGTWEDQVTNAGKQDRLTPAHKAHELYEQPFSP